MKNQTQDQRDWSFAKQALAELPPQQQKKHHKKKRRWQSYWAVIELSDGRRRAYQLSKDLQHAVQIETPKKAFGYLINRVIVVPISDYQESGPESGTAEMALGKILYIFKNPHRSDPRWISRGQFVKPTYNWLGCPRYRQMYNYLKHDYDPSSQRRIEHDLHRLVRPKCGEVVRISVRLGKK